MSTEQNRKAVTQLYEAFNRGDIATVVQGFSEDAVWVNHTGTGLAGVYYGRSGVRDFFTNFKAAVDLERFDIDRILCEDDTAVVLVETQYTVKATGKNAIGPVVQVLKMKDGLISAFAEYEHGHGPAWN